MGLPVPGEIVQRIYANCDDTANALQTACEGLKNHYSVLGRYMCVNFTSSVLDSLNPVGG